MTRLTPSQLSWPTRVPIVGEGIGSGISGDGGTCSGQKLSIRECNSTFGDVLRVIYAVQAL